MAISPEWKIKLISKSHWLMKGKSCEWKIISRYTYTKVSNNQFSPCFRVSLYAACNRALSVLKKSPFCVRYDELDEMECTGSARDRTSVAVSQVFIEPRVYLRASYEARIEPNNVTNRESALMSWLVQHERRAWLVLMAKGVQVLEEF